MLQNALDKNDPDAKKIAADLIDEYNQALTAFQIQKSQKNL